MTLKRSLIGILILLISILGLFWHQNAERYPMLDIHGNYLSFDLLFWGGAVSQPISVPSLMVISMVVGAILALIIRSVLGSVSNDSYSSEF